MSLTLSKRGVFYRAFDPYTSDDIHLRQSALLYMVKDQVEFSVERIFRLSAEAHLANVAAHRRMRMNDFQIRFAKDPWDIHLPQVSSMPSISKNFEAAYQSFAWTWHEKKIQVLFWGTIFDNPNIGRSFTASRVSWSLVASPVGPWPPEVSESGKGKSPGINAPKRSKATNMLHFVYKCSSHIMGVLAFETWHI